MFDLGWGEMLLIGVVALIVVGPKDLPVLFRSIGQFVGKARGLAREFSRAMEAAADESGIKEIDKTIRAATRPVQFATDRLREQTNLAKPLPKATLPPAGTPLAPLNPGAPLAAEAPAAPPGPAPEALSPTTPVEAPAAPPPPATAAGPATATDALRQRRSAERAELQAAAGDRRPAPDGTS